jgi:hypothetical protein
MKPDRLKIKEMLADLISEAHAAISTGEEVVYEEAVTNLVNFHTTLIKASKFINPQGQVDNYALIPAGSGLFSREVHQEWSQYYHNLFSVVISELSRNKSYFEQIANIPVRLFSGMYEVESPKILTNIIQLQSVLHYYLELWWANAVEEQGKLEHGICSPASLNPPFYTIYESALKIFIDNWEALKNYYFPPSPIEGNPAWDELRALLPFYETHLTETAFNMFISLVKGNQEAALWMQDILTRWSTGHQYRFHEDYNLLRHVKIFTIEQLAREWDDVKDIIDLDSAGVRAEEAPKELFSACLRNYWIDIGSIAIYTLIVWGKDCNCEKSLPANLINLLIKGISATLGEEEIPEDTMFTSASDVLVAILRQHYADDGYRNKLDGVVERVVGLRKAGMVSGRTYVSWGRDDLNSLRDGQLLLLCIFAKPLWNPIDQVEKIVRRWAVDRESALRLMQVDLTEWIDRLSNPEFQDLKKTFLCIKNTEGAGDDFEACVEIVKAAIEELKTFIKNVHLDQLAQAPVSPVRLNEIAIWASTRGFSMKNGGVPLSLFSNITYLKTRLDSRSLIIKDANKGEYTEHPMAQLPVNQDEWFAKIIEDNVAAHLMLEIIRKNKPLAVDASIATSYWEQLKQAALKIRGAGFVPILLVENRVSPAWLWNWTIAEYQKTKRPADMRLSRDKTFDQIKNYLGNFNDVAVFHAPLPPGASYLLGKEALKEVKFTEFIDNVYVEVTFEEHAEKKGLIDLKLSWAFELQIKECPTFKLEYSVIKGK